MTTEDKDRARIVAYIRDELRKRRQSNAKKRNQGPPLRRVSDKNRLLAPAPRIYVAVLFVLLCLATGLGYYNTLHQSHKQTQKIQRQRLAVTRDNCERQDARHDATIKALKRLSAVEQKRQPTALVQLFTLVGIKVSPTAKRRLIKFEAAQIAGNLKQTTFLINALAPRQDCEAQIAHVVGKPLPRVVLPIPPVLPNPDQQLRHG